MRRGKEEQATKWTMATRLGIYSCGLLMVGLALPESAFAFDSARWAIQELCAHIEGNLGALLMSAAGVGAVVSGAFGNFRASYGFLIVGIGAFSVSAILSLYFGAAATECQTGAQNGGATGTRLVGDLDPTARSVTVDEGERDPFGVLD